MPKILSTTKAIAMTRASVQPDDIRLRPSLDAAARLGDTRFRALLTAAEWAALPDAVRRRFSKRVGPGDTAIYTGHVERIEASRTGRLLANVCRVFGGPLPLSRDTGVASIVTVTEDAATGGQVWSRLYCRRSGPPQVIHSTKRFEGVTRLEEHVGCGIGMSLSVSVEPDALVFRSHRYFIAVGRIRVHLPRWLTPGQLTVKHIDRGDGRFAFTLDIVHPRFGALMHQTVGFADVHVPASHGER